MIRIFWQMEELTQLIQNNKHITRKLKKLIAHSQSEDPRNMIKSTFLLDSLGEKKSKYKSGSALLALICDMRTSLQDSSLYYEFQLPGLTKKKL